jgi:hypothetical protein
MSAMNGLLDRIVRRRRASASSRLGPPNGTTPADPVAYASANGSVRATEVIDAPTVAEPGRAADPAAQATDPAPPATDLAPPAADPARPAARQPAPPIAAPPARAARKAAAAAAPPAAAAPAAAVTATQPQGLRERSRIRRRTRFLRRLRELQIRDIGGFMLELHRFGRDRPDLVGAKLEAAAKTDRELRALERALGRERPLTDLREPGIGGACPACGTVHGSADHYCSWCGREL